MVVFKEILPNPAGKDTEGEWIKLVNVGEETVAVSGWTVSDISGKAHSLTGTVEGNQEILLEYSLTKIALNNNGDKLELKNERGEVLDTISYESASDDEIIIADRFIEEVSVETSPRLESVQISGGQKIISGGETSAILVALALATTAAILVGWFARGGEEK